MFARREEERAALSRHAGVLWQMGFRSRKKKNMCRAKKRAEEVLIFVFHTLGQI